MNLLKTITAGFIGSVTLNFLHERTMTIATNVKAQMKVNGNLDLDSFEQINEPLFNNTENYDQNLLRNIISNTFFFSTIGFGKPKNFYLRGISLGLAAGLSAAATGDNGALNQQKITLRNKSNVRNTIIYVAGGLVTASILSLFKTI